MTNAITIEHIEETADIYVNKAYVRQFEEINDALANGRSVYIAATPSDTYAGLLDDGETIEETMDEHARVMWDLDWPRDEEEYWVAIIDPINRRFTQVIGPNIGIDCDL
jgi:hypothetical protein